ASPFSSRRRSTGNQLARLPAAGKAISKNVSGGAARAGALTARLQPVDGNRRSGEIRLRTPSCGRAVLHRLGASRYNLSAAVRGKPCTIFFIEWRPAPVRLHGRISFIAGDAGTYRFSAR